jgi:hypothetical protein
MIWHDSFAIVTFYDTVNGIGEEVHNDIQELLLTLLSEECLLHLEHINVLQLFQNLELSVLVLLVLQNFLYGDYIESVLVTTLVDDPKCPTADNFFKNIFARD